MLGDELVTGDGVHGACLSSFDPGCRSFCGGAVHLAQVSGAPGSGTSVQSTDLRTDDVWLAASVEQPSKLWRPVLGLTWQDAPMTRLPGNPPERLARAGVTEREAEVLSAVAERLHNREIADRLYISVRTVESHISALLRKLGVDDRAALVAVGAELGRAAQPGTALPVLLTSFVGRERETDEIAGLLQGHRLVTLTGPAGAGKTRLGVQVAGSGVEGLPDDVRLADLAAVASADLVADTLARSLGVSPQPTRPVRDSLRDAARELQGLLLVDNCEHVVAEAAAVVSDLLTAGDQLRVLATSREVLGVPGEVSYAVQPLPIPSGQAASRAAAAAGYDAVRLFVDRAMHASPGFALTDANAAAVAALCQRLDGLPLAIELAASRVRSFPPATLLEFLDQRFELLSAGARTALPRHRTLRAAIDWSYDLLGDQERALFDRLGVFPADFDYDAVQAVCATGGSGGDSVVRVLPALVDKSLVSTAGGDTPRYRLLESLRAYAAARLAGSGADTDARQRHAAHYLAVAELAAGRLRGPEQRMWLDRLTIEQPNLRAGLAHIVANGDVETALRWLSALELFGTAPGSVAKPMSGSSGRWRAVNRPPRRGRSLGSPQPASSCNHGTTRPRWSWPNGPPSSRRSSATPSGPGRPRRWAWRPPTGSARSWRCPRCTRRWTCSGTSTRGSARGRCRVWRWPPPSRLRRSAGRVRAWRCPARSATARASPTPCSSWPPGRLTSASPTTRSKGGWPRASR
jgi:predicted ATPase/DNA-binding CsgD family transcriptional regulator